ncbi:MAG: VCBS repeat-containing protein [Bacteroidales bacterium]|nr:VCBS repeat-containing protein [Bacteroidales bacterium]
MMKRLWPLLLILLCPFAEAQTYDFGFQRDLSVPVVQQGRRLAYPWAGGMNSVHMSEIDLNGDGKKDLFVFEKNGNRILTFLHTDSGYRIDPAYAAFFPTLHDWVILKDYNHDGKEDIFTYGMAGISVFQNVSDTVPKFKLITKQLEAYYYNGMSNIYASPDDYMAIEDVDGDGDIDILNFWLLGKYVHYIRNYAVENGQGEDFAFKLEDECWGKFAEGESNNEITLHISCEEKGDGDGVPKHVGSSIFARDLTGNGLTDIVVGDVDYPNLILLKNGGTHEKALMTAIDTAFPNASMPVNLFSMPAITFVDVDGDGAEEIIASPSDPSLTKSQNVESVWLYVKDSLTGRYELQNKSFLQEDMIDVGGGSYPVLYDWDGDGLQDLFIGNYGTLDSAWFEYGYLKTAYSSSVAYYRNTGTAAAPAFELVTADFGSLCQYGLQALYPAFGDFNGDGRTDLLCGQRDGTLLLVANMASADALAFAAPQFNYGQIDVGDFSTPCYFDLDGDGKNDLLIGNRRGHIVYYRHIASSDIPQFELVTDTLGGVDVRDFELSYFGFAVPCFFRNAQNQTILFCGNEQGYVSYYKDIDNNLDGVFTLKQSALFEVRNRRKYDIDEGCRVAPAVADLDGDGYPDLLVGNYAGGIAWYKGTTPPDDEVGIPQYSDSTITVYPNPATSHVRVAMDYGCDKVLILNLQGQCVGEQQIANGSFSVANLPAGMYILRFYHRQSVVGTAKLVKNG